MAGHSKWANIKYRKERQDKKRSQLFARLIREIMISARHDPNPETNPTLASALERARAANVPKENVERAIKRAAGEEGRVHFEEAFYEGYGPGGVAVLVRSLTDNRNRTAASVRRIFDKYGGSLGTEGCVAWQFERRGSVRVGNPPEEIDQEELVLLAIENGAEDFAEEDEGLTFRTEPTDVARLRDGLKAADIQVERAEITWEPKATIPVTGREAERVLQLLNELDEQDDVQDVVANFDIPDEVLAQVEGG
ncbi:MAG: YebC/PmpR family DNA-binding transcriptional regulator [Candidatus Bipolaricaulota bacterium]